MIDSDVMKTRGLYFAFGMIVLGIWLGGWKTMLPWALLLLGIADLLIIAMGELGEVIENAKDGRVARRTGKLAAVIQNVEH